MLVCCMLGWGPLTLVTELGIQMLCGITNMAIQEILLGKVSFSIGLFLEGNILKASSKVAWRVQSRCQ